jgi:hypothetical protein
MAMSPDSFRFTVDVPRRRPAVTQVPPVPYQRLAVAVLADWFEVERTLRLVPTRSREALLLRAEARGLRDEYQRLVDAAVQFHMAVPKRFPGTVLLD